MGAAGNPYNSHIHAEALEQVEVLIDRRPAPADAGHGYRGHGDGTTQVLISRTRRGLPPKLAQRRRSAKEPETADMKTDGRLARGPLNGAFGHAPSPSFCACGHNIRETLATSGFFWLF